jgi:hypothetical protein
MRVLQDKKNIESVICIKIFPQMLLGLEKFIE